MEQQQQQQPKALQVVRCVGVNQIRHIMSEIVSDFVVIYDARCIAEHLDLSFGFIQS